LFFPKPAQSALAENIQFSILNKMFLPSSQLSPESRLWIYQADRELTSKEEEFIGENTIAFLEKWTAHNNELKASYEIRYHRFLIIMVDENHNSAGGCSIDKCLHLIQQFEKAMNISFLNRLLLAYKDGDKIQVVSKSKFEDQLHSGILNENTIVFNNLITTKAELETSWEIPMEKSWHKVMLATK
jgi:hypothetical protein